MKQIILKIDGMSCSACSNGLEKYLNKQKGIIDAHVNLVLAQASIKYDDNIDINDLNRFVEEAGFTSLGIYDYLKENKKDNRLKYIIFMALLVFIILYITMAHMLGLPKISFLDMEKYPKRYGVVLLILVLPFLIYGFDIFKSGIKNLYHKTPNMDSLVTLGIIVSFSYSLFSLYMLFQNHNEYVASLYFESCAVIIFFVKLGRFIDQKSKDKTSEAIKDLVSITPSTALLKVDNEVKEVTIDEVKKDDVLICKPGLKIATDGIIVDGQTHLDEAFLTGESKPSKKGVGDIVMAGSINLDGYIEYKATRIGKNSTISEIVHLVSEAVNTKPPISRLADKICGYFVPSIMLIALLTLLGYIMLHAPFNECILSFITVLVVACPCALGLATPLAVVVSMGMSAKKGILIKNSTILEMANQIDTIVFDKTGTLTYGNLKISKVFNYSKLSDKKLIELVSAMENNSSHPISKAFKDYLTSEIKVQNFQNIEGKGLKATYNKKPIYVGSSKLCDDLKINNLYVEDANELLAQENTVIYVIVDKEIIGLIGVKDIIRKDAKKTISTLHHLNKNVIMLTGDNDKVANVVAQNLHIDKVIANVLPKEKSKVIKSLLKEGKKVMMVGDGINDAPSLAQASIGVSFSGGTDIAVNSADVILTHNELTQIIDLINISKKTITNIKQNLFWAFFYNICMIPVAVGILKPFGISMNPMIGALAMTLSSLTVVFNALRLRIIKK